MDLKILGKIFGSVNRVKLMRLFLFSPEISFKLDELVEKSKIKKIDIKKELKNLEDIKFINKKKGKNSKDGFFYLFNQNFVYKIQLQDLLINIGLFEKKDLISRFNSIGNIKLFLVSGIFIQDKNSRVDMLLVVDNLKEGSLAQIIKNFEAEIGKEISYAFFNQAEFIYRLNMRDKLICDIINSNNREIVNSLKLSTGDLRKF